MEIIIASAVMTRLMTGLTVHMFQLLQLAVVDFQAFLRTQVNLT
jgi:hypothetical protein